MKFGRYLYCPRCYNTLIFIVEDLISCPKCGLSVNIFKENGIKNFEILSKSELVKIPKLQKKLVRINTLSKR